MKYVRIEADDWIAVPGNCRVLDAETGKPVPGVRSAKIDLTIGEPVTAVLQIGPGSVSVARAKAGFSMIDPTDGSIKSVTAIQFADGSMWEADTE